MENKEWNVPEIKEMNLEETQYGGKNIADFDNIYQNDEQVWEGTYVRS